MDNSDKIAPLSLEIAAFLLTRGSSTDIHTYGSLTKKDLGYILSGITDRGKREERLLLKGSFDKEKAWKEMMGGGSDL